MITIRHDGNLADFARIMRITEQKAVSVLMLILSNLSDDDYLAGMTLGKLIKEGPVEGGPLLFIHHVGWHCSIPLSVSDTEIVEAIEKLRLWYVDPSGSLENPCSNCGYELMEDKDTTPEITIFKCPICRTIKTITP